MHGSWAPWSTSNFPCLYSSTFTFFHPVDKHKYCVVSSLPCFQFQHVIFWKLSIIQSGSWVYLSINTWCYDLWLLDCVHSQHTVLLQILCCFCITIELYVNQSVKLHLYGTEEPATEPTFRYLEALALLGLLSLSLWVHLGAQKFLQWHSCMPSPTRGRQQCRLQCS